MSIGRFCVVVDGTEPPITDDGRSQQGGALEAQGEPSGTSIVKEGYLNKQPSNGIRRAWQRRFFKLDSAGNFYYENGEGGSFRVSLSSHLFRESSLQTCCASDDFQRVKLGDSPSNLRLLLNIVYPPASFAQTKFTIVHACPMTIQEPAGTRLECFELNIVGLFAT